VPLWQTEKDFPGDERSPAGARRFCTDRLGGVLGHDEPATDLVGAAQLIVSELVSNSVHAHSSAVSVRLSVDELCVRIGVRDDGAGLPTPRTSSASETNGRGLAIVAALSSAWGVTKERASKTVWAELSLPESLTTCAAYAAVCG
jgi:anti-sigma regulatory factor (Ser/Thr protein kinase)